VGVGIATADAKLHAFCEDNQASDVADPDACWQMEGDTINQNFQWYMANDGWLYAYDETGDVVFAAIQDGGTGRQEFGDVENLTANTGAIRIRTFAAGVPALEIEAASAQTANIFNVRDSAGTLLYSIDKDGSLIAPGLTSTASAITGTVAATFQSTLTATGAASLDGGAAVTGTFEASDSVVLNSVRVTSTPYSAGNEFLIVVDTNTAGGTVTIDLPECASNDGKAYFIKNAIDNNSIILDGFASETIDIATTYTISANPTEVRGSVFIICEASIPRWHVVSGFNENFP
jgi:hypothetical protein